MAVTFPQTCGKVGKIVKVDEDGDVAVAFGRKVHLYAPSCCQQGAGLKPDTLSSSNENSGNSGNGGDSGDNDQGGKCGVFFFFNHLEF